MATIPAEARQAQATETHEGILRGMLVEFDTPGELIAAALDQQHARAAS